MNKRRLVNARNTLTGKYGLVPAFLVEHPVFGEHLEEVDAHDVPCDCPSGSEDFVNPFEGVEL